ncbi:MAG: hypothetical protein LBH19_13835 [Dysgonamonadaceae bacterium]|jgi:hypothetical protein|nr:hypothetical protein [Dysgonamonadaceae bacterium]
METKFTEQESLSLITEMITKARNNFQKRSGDSMIFSGILVSVTALLNVALAFILDHPNQSFWIWCIMIPGSFVNNYIRQRNRKEALVKTHIDSIITFAWIGFACAVGVILAVIFGLGFGRKMYEVFHLINPSILVMTGLAEFVTAKACRFKPYFYGSLIMWAGSIACVGIFWISYNPVIVQFFILALCMITGFVVPGYQLNKAAKSHV